ncbi:MAG: NAD(P)-binding domain-containing protein, partial [Candidatus Stahlbacteria bacterium]|nr:NAD(P)-binding domain-containing protein [Candidatus Stahlbacteria bacterium]
MKIGIIGPGRVGTALGEAFKEAGYKIVGIVSRRRLLAQKCMRLTQCNNWSSNPQDIAKLADIILITVPDAEIGNIVQTLSTVVRVKGPAPTHNVGGPAPTH